MAGIDKTYVSKYSDYKRYYDWCLSKNYEFSRLYNGELLTSYFYIYDEEDFKNNTDLPICNTPTYMDIYLIRNCPLEFVQNRLKEQYCSEYTKIKNYKSEYDNFKMDRIEKKDCRFTVTWNNKFCKFKKPWGTRYWWVQVRDSGKYNLYYDEESDSWVDPRELMPWNTNTAMVKSFKSLTRKIKKWRFPEGTVLSVTGRYVCDRMTVTVKRK